MINEMNARLKDLEQQIREKDVANAGLQAKLSIHGLDKAMLFDHANTLHLVAHQLGVAPGDDVTRAVPGAVRRMIAERNNIIKHAVHAARCQLIGEIKSAFAPYDKLTAEQVIGLICAEKETVNEA
jgi:hypothetical protein